MKRQELDLDPLDAFLEPRKIDRVMPADMRERSLARAGAFVATEGAVLSVRRAKPLIAPPARVPRGRMLIRIAMAASVALALGAVGAVAALRVRAPRVPPSASPPVRSRAIASAPARAKAATAPSPSQPAEERATAPRVAMGQRRAMRRMAGPDDPFTAEVALLQRTQAAYTRRDFSGALASIGEHARRFPKGHLAEEREALRVRSLAGAGRNQEAHRAAAAFYERFPRSVLLPRLEEGSEALE